MRVRAQTAAALRAMAGEAPLDLVVTGECMTPLLESGDRVRVAPQRLYWPGDVVAFRRRDDNRLLVHRVLGYTISLRGLRLLAKGDHLSREDEPVSLESIVGRVVERRGRGFETRVGERLRSLVVYLRVLLRRSIAPWHSATSS